MKRNILLVTAVLAIAFTATSGFAFGPGKGRSGDGSPGFGQGVWKNLSKAQQDQIKSLRQKFIDDTYRLRSDIMLKHHQARMLMETSSPDRAELTKLLKDANQLKAQVIEKRIDFMLAAKKVAPELKFRNGFELGHGGFEGRGKKGACGNYQKQACGQGRGEGCRRN